MIQIWHTNVVHECKRWVTYITKQTVKEQIIKSSQENSGRVQSISKEHLVLLNEITLYKVLLTNGPINMSTEHRNYVSQFLANKYVWRKIYWITFQVCYDYVGCKRCRLSATIHSDATLSEMLYAIDVQMVFFLTKHH